MAVSACKHGAAELLRRLAAQPPVATTAGGGAREGVARKVALYFLSVLLYGRNLVT